MKSSNVYLSSRLSSRAVLAGTISTFALMILFMILAAAFGLWSFNLSDLRRAGVGFWLWGFSAWILSLYISSYVTAIASRSITRRDGALHGFIIWATVSVFGGIFLGAIDASAFRSMTPTMFWLTFFADLIALGAAVYGGVQGSAAELEAEDIEERQITHQEKLRA